MNTGTLIRNARKAKNLTQKQLGELSGIAEPTIRRYELGKLNPKRETLRRIADALNVPLGVLLVDPDIFNFDSRPDSGFDLAAHITPLDDSELTETIKHIRVACSKLNSVGQQEAIKRVEELTEIPRYQAGKTSQNGAEPTPAPPEGKDTTTPEPPPESP